MRTLTMKLGQPCVINNQRVVFSGIGARGPAFQVSGQQGQNPRAPQCQYGQHFYLGDKLYIKPVRQLSCGSMVVEVSGSESDYIAFDIGEGVTDAV